jgi:hypothetical protein
MHARKLMFTTILTILVVNGWIVIARSDSRLQNASQDDSSYRTIGPFEGIGRQTDGQRRRAIAAEIRAFLWESFKDHYLAHVAVTYFSIEGEPSTFTYVVDRDGEGIWRIHLNINSRHNQPFASPPSWSYSSDDYDAYSLERISPTTEGSTPRKFSDSEDVSADGFKLRLIDKDGKVIQVM